MFDGGFSGLASVMEDLPGKVCIIGTPAEEGGAGKVKLLKNGALDDVDFALMMHPSSGGSNLCRTRRPGRLLRKSTLYRKRRTFFRTAKMESMP